MQVPEKQHYPKKTWMMIKKTSLLLDELELRREEEKKFLPTTQEQFLYAQLAEIFPSQRPAKEIETALEDEKKRKVLRSEFLDAAKDADGFIFGAPVHFASASASMIAFLDRSFYADHCAGLNRFAFKPGAAIVSARRAGTSAALDELNKYLLYAQMPIVSSRYWDMVHGHTPAQVRQDEEGMQIMRVLGRNMAWMLNSLKIAADAGLPLPEQEKRISTNYIR